MAVPMFRLVLAVVCVVCRKRTVFRQYNLIGCEGAGQTELCVWWEVPMERRMRCTCSAGCICGGQTGQRPGYKSVCVALSAFLLSSSPLSLSSYRRTVFFPSERKRVCKQHWRARIFSAFSQFWALFFIRFSPLCLVARKSDGSITCKRRIGAQV